MKWIKSFLLHPFFNRFNLLFLGGGAVLGIFAQIPYLGWFVLAIEGGYLILRSILDRSNIPAFRMRRLAFKDRSRYLRLWNNVDQTRRDLTASNHIAGAMAASAEQLDRLRQSFLNLLLLRRRLDRYLRTQPEDYPALIAKTKQRMGAAEPTEQKLLQSNIDVLKKRQKVFTELLKKRRSLDTRLDTIENSLRLLSEVTVGLTDPDEVSSQVEVILANVEDAESFVHELNEVVAPLRVRT